MTYKKKEKVKKKGKELFFNENKLYILWNKNIMCNKNIRYDEKKSGNEIYIKRLTYHLITISVNIHSSNTLIL